MRYIKNGTLKSILLIIIGATILSFGSYNFNYQNNVTEGGVLGLLLLLQHVFNISPSITSVVIDGNTYYYITDTEGSKYKVSIKVEKDILPFLNKGSVVEVYYNSKTDVTSITKLQKALD